MAEDGGVAVMNEEGTIVYRIAPPYMYDADDNLSMAVSYSLTQIKNTEYALTVTANEEWINSPERVFPVTIDPSVSPQMIRRLIYKCRLTIPTRIIVHQPLCSLAHPIASIGKIRRFPRFLTMQ